MGEFLEEINEDCYNTQQTYIITVGISKLQMISEEELVYHNLYSELVSLLSVIGQHL